MHCTWCRNFQILNTKCTPGSRMNYHEMNTMMVLKNYYVLSDYLGYRWLFIYNKRNIVLFLVISLKETIRYSPWWIPLDILLYHRIYSIFIDLFSVMSSLTFPLRIHHSSDDTIYVHDTAYFIKSDKAEHILKIKLSSLTYWRDGKYIYIVYNILWFSRHGTKYYLNVFLIVKLFWVCVDQIFIYTSYLVSIAIVI